MRRVVVTGMGAISPFGVGVDVLWNALLSGANGISEIRHLPLRGDIVKIAGVLPKVNFGLYKKEDLSLFDRVPEDISVKSSFIAVYEAIGQAGVEPRQMGSNNRVGTFIADRNLGAIEYIDQYAPLIARCTAKDGRFNKKRFYDMLCETNIGEVPPDVDPDSINHFVSRAYHITGMQLSAATACASGNTAIGEAFHKIRNGYLDMAIAGGSYNFDLSVMIGFTRLNALTTNPDPDRASCPFDARRDGFVMGSGCGILIIEALETAKRRKADILCELTGYGYSSDAFRSTDPDPESSGATQAIRSCLEMAKLPPDKIGYINAHGTSTKMNDLSETRAIKNALGSHAFCTPVSSTKSMIGHSIMASAAIEGIVCIKSIQESMIHPTRNWRERDQELDLDYVPGEYREIKIDYALSNSFGFGGQNTSILFSKFTG